MDTLLLLLGGAGVYAAHTFLWARWLRRQLHVPPPPAVTLLPTPVTTNLVDTNAILAPLRAEVEELRSQVVSALRDFTATSRRTVEEQSFADRKALDRLAADIVTTQTAEVRNLMQAVDALNAQLVTRVNDALMALTAARTEADAKQARAFEQAATVFANRAECLTAETCDDLALTVDKLTGLLNQHTTVFNERVTEVLNSAKHEAQQRKLLEGALDGRIAGWNAAVAEVRQANADALEAAERALRDVTEQREHAEKMLDELKAQRDMADAEIQAKVDAAAELFKRVETASLRVRGGTLQPFASNTGSPFDPIRSSGDKDT